MDSRATNKEYLFKKVIIENYDSYYYKKLRKSIPEKIAKGEIEWIYSYGDKLMARGYKSVFEAVKNILETKNCENPYVNPELLYLKCHDLYAKYKRKRFWPFWFK